MRSGLLGEQQLYDEVLLAVTTDLPDLDDPEGLARSWVAELRAELLADQAGWPAETDYDRLQAAFADLAGLDVEVLQGCEDHWAAKALLDARAGDPPRGVAWFTPPDVWHAIDEGMLEVNVWHGSTANVAPGDAAARRRAGRARAARSRGPLRRGPGGGLRPLAASASERIVLIVLVRSGL